MTDQDILAVVETYRDAYNAKDMEALAATLSPDLRLRHHNRGVDLSGREAIMDVIRSFEKIAPDRRLHSVRRRIVSGENVVVEQSWDGPLTADIEGFGAAGETVSFELCTVFTVRDGVIVEYDDYG